MRYTPAQVLFSASLFSVLNIVVRIALDSGAHVLTIVTLRSLVVVVVLALFFPLIGVSLRLPAQARNVGLLVGAVASVHSYALATAIGLLPVALAILVFYTFPIITSVATWIRDRQRPDTRTVIALILALCGITLALGVEFSTFDMVGLALAALSAVSWSVILLISAHFFRGVDPRARTFYMQVALLVFFALGTLATGIVEFPGTASGWYALAAVPFLYIIAMIILLAAASRIGAMKAAFYMNFEPIVTVALSMIFLHETLSPVQLAGAAMVVAALLSLPKRQEPLQPQH